jgi:hypothetical protein
LVEKANSRVSQEATLAAKAGSRVGAYGTTEVVPSRPQEIRGKPSKNEPKKNEPRKKKLRKKTGTALKIGHYNACFGRAT